MLEVAEIVWCYTIFNVSVRKSLITFESTGPWGCEVHPVDLSIIHDCIGSGYKYRCICTGTSTSLLFFHLVPN